MDLKFSFEDRSSLSMIVSVECYLSKPNALISRTEWLMEIHAATLNTKSEKMILPVLLESEKYENLLVEYDFLHFVHLHAHFPLDSICFPALF